MAGEGVNTTRIAMRGCCLGLIFALSFVVLVLIRLATPGGGAADTTSSNTGGITSDTTTATMSSKQLSWIKSSKSAYQIAADKYGIPWQLVAALHCREAGCNPAKSALSGEVLGSANPDNPSIVTSDLQDSLNLAARHIKGSANDVYGVKLGMSNTALELEKAFVSYNRGYMYKTGRCDVTTSPYALNNFDQAHYHMRWPNSSCEPSSTRGNINIPNGAYTVYVYLINKGI